jgi:MarR family transcriptional regulator, organic hydroperoxide resistance regulator
MMQRQAEKCSLGVGSRRASGASRRKSAAVVRTLVPERNIPGVGLGVLLRNADMSFNRVLRDELALHNVTFSEFQHLWQLFGSGGNGSKRRSLTQAELSRRIGIQTASSTAVIDQLARRKLIRRERDPNDRRRINVSLTPAGRALEKPLTACAVAVNALARKGLSKAEINVLADILRRVMRNLGT